MYLDSWTEHSRFLCSAVLYSVGLHFHHQSHPRLGTVSLWFSLFVPGAISPLFSSNILGPSLPGARIFQCHLFFCLFILFCLRSLSVSRRYEVSKYDFALLRHRAFSFAFGRGVGSSVLLPTAAQGSAATPEFSQEGTRARPSTPPSCFSAILLSTLNS